MASIYTEVSEDIYRDIMEEGVMIMHDRCFEGVTQTQYEVAIYRFEGGIYAVNRRGNDVVFCNRLY